MSDKLQRPRSLGVIGGNEFTTRPVLSAYDPEIVNKATYAVTVEPPAGRRPGLRTGPIVFTGKLVETVPPARRSRRRTAALIQTDPHKKKTPVGSGRFR